MAPRITGPNPHNRTGRHAASASNRAPFRQEALQLDRMLQGRHVGVLVPQQDPLDPQGTVAPEQAVVELLSALPPSGGYAYRKFVQSVQNFLGSYLLLTQLMANLAFADYAQKLNLRTALDGSYHKIYSLRNEYAGQLYAQTRQIWELLALLYARADTILDDLASSSSRRNRARRHAANNLNKQNCRQSGSNV